MPSPILPFKSFGPATAPVRPSISVGPGGRAQNFGVSKLNQKVEREQSAVSMSQVLSRKAGIENSRSTSVAHIGQAMSAPSTSITHPGSVRLAGADGDADPGADNRRYAYMRKQILARKASEAAAAKESAGARKGLDVSTGAGMRKTGVGGIHKQLGKEFRAHRTTYSSLTSKEKQVLEKTISGRLGSKTTGSEISRFDKKAMKKDIKKAHDSGDVSFGHAKILKKVVDKLT